MRRYGREQAAALQGKAGDMTGTELYANEDFIPEFRKACATKNMQERSMGFVCKTTAGRVVKLLQPYDSDTFTAEPEDLPALWGFMWSQDPEKALPFIALSTSPYNTGDCCLDNGKVFRSKNDGNVHVPSAWPAGWEEV